MKRNILLCILVIFAATSCNDLKQDGLTDPQQIVQNLKSPTNLHIRVEDENVLQLSWEDNCKIEENFHIYRRKGSEDYTLYKTLPANTTQWQDDNVILGNSYSYRIFAIKGKYSSEGYAESSFLYKLFAPSNLIVEAVTDSRIKLSWGDTNHFEEGYKIDRKRGSSAWEENFAAVPTNITYWEHTLDGSEGSIVIWRVKAYYKSLQGENSTESSITVAEPVFSPSGGTYTSAQNVTISCATNGATIRYTTDGSTPSNSSTIYSGAVLINKSTTLKAKAFKSGWRESDTSEASYNLKVASPTFYPAGGTYSSPQSVTINCATPGNVIRYTTDGSVPNSSSAQYSSAIQVSSKTTIKAKAFKSGWMESDASEASYNLKVASPTFNPVGGTYLSPQSVTINCATSGATIRYTTDGSVPNSSSALYSSAIQVNSDTTIKAIAFKSGWADADVATSSYSIQLSAVATPFFSIAGGTYYLPQNVSISCATSGATIRYTTDGSTPTSSSTIYSSAISINGSTTLKAKAFKQGSQDSNTATASYNMKVYNPTFSPGGGSYSSAQSVSISCGTSGATIRYTTNGSTPTNTSTLYSGAISINKSTVLKAKAFKSGWTSSEVASANYSIAHAWIGWCYPDSTGKSIGTNGVVQFDVAHRYEASVLANYTGSYLTNVKIWPAYADCIYTIKVWTGTSASQPSSLIHSQVIGNPTIGAWNDITLNTSISIPTSGELWIGYGVNTQSGYPARCDTGPAFEGKGNMINWSPGGWDTLSNLNPNLTYNWLILCYIDGIPSRVINFAETEIIEEVYDTPRGTLKALKATDLPSKRK